LEVHIFSKPKFLESGLVYVLIFHKIRFFGPEISGPRALVSEKSRKIKISLRLPDGSLHAPQNPIQPQNQNGTPLVLYHHIADIVE